MSHAARHAPAEPAPARDSRRLRWVLAAVLAVVTLITYWPVRQQLFLNIDDDIYVTENRHVKQGLTWEGVRWAFQSTEEANYWHPLTWLTHMADVEIYGLNPAGHHFTNAWLHTVNAVVLFLVLAGMTVGRWGRGDTIWRAFFVAGLFALHPLHVESVAWLSERKDLLCALFWFLTMGAYGRYARGSVPGSGFRVPGSNAEVRTLNAESRAARGWYVLSLLLFGGALMAKPMAVTLPFVLLLLDGWPLQRFQVPAIARATADSSGFGCQDDLKPETRHLKPLLLEKIPFFALTIGLSAWAFVTQSKGDVVSDLSNVPMSLRAGNALVAYGTYLVKMIWPVNLTVYYPHPLDVLPVWKVVVAAVALVGITVAVARSWRRRPYLLMGWCWYVGTLVPVIGFVQIGSFAMADRYTYIPLVGVFIMIAWGLGDGWRGRVAR